MFTTGEPEPLPPGPVLTRQEWIGFERDQPRSLHLAAEKFGPLFTVHAEGRNPRVYVGDPKSIRDIFVRNGHNLRAMGPTSLRSLVGEHSVAFLQGAAHLRARTVLSRALRDEDAPDIESTTARITAAEIDQVPVHPGTPLEAFTNLVTRRIIVAFTLGDPACPLAADVLSALGAALDGLHERHAALLSGDADERDSRDFEVTVARLHMRVRAAVRDHLHTLPGHRPHGIVGSLVRAGAGTEQELVDHVLTLLVSGHETVSSALAWTLTLLARHPDMRERVRAELRSTHNHGDPHYLTAACLESLRHSPPVPNGHTRQVQRVFDAAGYRFSPPVEVVPCASVTHRQARTYSCPERYSPHRFVGAAYAANEFIPFGIGTRYCPGAATAVRELVTAVAVITRHPGIAVRVPEQTGIAMSIGSTVRVPAEVAVLREP